MASDKKMDEMTEKISEGINDGISQVMKPVFENLANEISKVMSGLEERQKESMKLMAAAFLQEMRSREKAVFADVTSNIDKICANQAETVARLNSTVESLLKEQENSRRLHEEMAKQINSLANISQTVSETQIKVNVGVSRQEQMFSQFSGIERSFSEKITGFEDRQNEWIINYKQCDDMLAESSRAAVASIESCARNLTNVSDSIIQNLEKINETITASMERYHESVDRDIDQTFAQFDNNMAAIARTLGQAAEEICEASRKIPMALKGSIDELQRGLAR